MKRIITNIREYDGNKGRDIVFKSFVDACKKKGAKVYDAFNYRLDRNLDEILLDSSLVLYREDQIKNKIEKIREMQYKMFLSDILNKKSPKKENNKFGEFIKFSKKVYDQLKYAFRKKTQFLVADPKENISNKWNAIKLAKKMKIPVPITYLANKVGKKLKFPFVSKHKNSSCGRGNRKINNEIELVEQIERYGTSHHILQELIRGPLYKEKISGYIRVITFGGNSKNYLNVLGAQAVFNLNEDTFVNKDGAESSIVLIGKNKKKKLSVNERKGLYACGLEKLDVPDEILSWSSKLGAAASDQGSQFNTIDFSYNYETNQHYFLGDVNKFPGFGCLNSLFGRKQAGLKEKIYEAGKILADRFEKCFYN